MIAFRMPNGSLFIPKRVEGKAEDGSTIVGEGMIEAKPGTKDFDEWKPFAQDPPAGMKFPNSEK